MEKSFDEIDEMDGGGMPFIERIMVPTFEIAVKPHITIAQVKAKNRTPEGCIFVWDEQEGE